jgi:hypothetical protein
MIGVYVWNKIGSEKSFIVSKWIDPKVIFLTGLVTYAFMIRTTSVVGWFPLIFYSAFL